MCCLLHFQLGSLHIGSGSSERFLILLPYQPFGVVRGFSIGFRRFPRFLDFPVQPLLHVRKLLLRLFQSRFLPVQLRLQGGEVRRCRRDVCFQGFLSFLQSLLRLCHLPVRTFFRIVIVLLGTGKGGGLVLPAEGVPTLLVLEVQLLPGQFFPGCGQLFL